MKRKLAGAAITMLLAGLAAGCGSSDGDDATTDPAPASLAKPEFIAQADAICGVAKAKIEAGAKKLREVGAKSGALAVPLVTQFLEQTSLPAYETMLGELRGLTPPVADEKTVDGYVAALANAIDTVKADPVTYSKATAPADPFANANARAKSYGMKVCGT
jgi:hypothetical protein